MIKNPFNELVIALMTIVISGCIHSPKKLLSEFKLISVEENGLEKSYEYVKNSSKKIYVKRILSVGQEEQMRYFNDTINYMKSLYTITQDPYFGAEDGSLKCVARDQFDKKIQYNTDYNFIAYHLPSNSNLAYGDCEFSKSEWKSELILFYCKKSKIFNQIKLFYLKSQPVTIDKLEFCQQEI